MARAMVLMISRPLSSHYMPTAWSIPDLLSANRSLTAHRGGRRRCQEACRGLPLEAGKQLGMVIGKRSRWPCRSVMLPHDLVGELHQRPRLAQRSPKVLSADVEQSVVRLVLEAEQPAQQTGRLLATRHDLLHELRCLAMVLAACAPAERRTAGCVRRGDACKNRQCSGRAGVFDVAAFTSDQLRDVEELAGVLQTSSGLCRVAWLGARRAACHARLSNVVTSGPVRVIASARSSATIGGASARSRSISASAVSAMPARLPVQRCT
jgi:hypothetical protein